MLFVPLRPTESRKPAGPDNRSLRVQFLIPTRKMKLNSKRFCLGDLIPFDFS